MHTLRFVIECAWIVFWIYWLVAASGKRNLATTFPRTYPEYRSRTKMLIPFLL